MKLESLLLKVLVSISATFVLYCVLTYPSHTKHEIELEQASVASEASVSEQDVAHHILTSAKKKFTAGGKASVSKTKHSALTQKIDGFTLDARAAAVLNSKSAHHNHELNLQFSKKGAKAPTTSLLKRMPGYVAKSKESARQKLEAKIAAHKLTTRGLVKAVQQAEEQHFKELNQDLKDQTDDLIIAKINEITKRHKGGVNDYVLKNALTPEERKELALKKVSAAATPSASRAAWRPHADEHRKAASRLRLQQKNPAILKSTGGAKGGDPESLLSSYDREILAHGPDAALAPAPSPRPPGYIPPGTAPMLSQVPYAQPAPARPYYPAAPAPYPALAAPYTAVPPSSYAYFSPPQPAPYAAQTYVYGADGPYAAQAPAAWQATSLAPPGPAPYAAPYAAPYGPMPAYAGYTGYGPYGAAGAQGAAGGYGYGGYAEAAGTRYAEAGPGRYYSPGYPYAPHYTPPAQALQQQYPPASNAPQQQPQPPPYAGSPPAAYGPVPRAPAFGGGSGGGGGGTLWKLFSGGASTGSDEAASRSGGAVPMPPPVRRGRRGRVGAGGVAGAGGGIAAQMAALRESILSDYRSTIHKGQQAGYLPPPP